MVAKDHSDGRAPGMARKEGEKNVFPKHSNQGVVSK